MNQELHYLSTKETRKLVNVTTITLRNWDKTGKVRTIRSPSGARLYCAEDLGVTTVKPKLISIIYARVSSSKQKDDLERQVAFLKKEKPNHTLITDVGSGINWKRKGFLKILDHILEESIDELVVTHKDRLCRFGFEIIEHLCKQRGIELCVLQRREDQSEEQELAEDLLAIVHIYSCRANGKRRYENKKNTNISKSKTKDGIEQLEEHDEICV